MTRRSTTVRKASSDGEDQLIKRIARVIPSIKGAAARMPGFGGVRLGIGDDAAILAPTEGTELVLSCDAFLEGVHFDAALHPADSGGFKSLVRATSDLAAMGARPKFFLLTITLPASRTGKWLDDFLQGMSRAARQLGMRLVGGDTTTSRTISMSITVVGEVHRGRAITRSGARPGDILYVSGRLGRAQLGLELIKIRATGTLKRGLKSQSRLLQPHLYPKIPVELGVWLSGQRVASAMMDLSDGLSTDLPRLCFASGVGARVWADRIPHVTLPNASSSRSAAPQFAKLRLDALQMALHGGEDYELLFAVPPRFVKRLRRAPGFSRITAIGEIERGREIVIVGTDGKAAPLVSRGWDPFRRNSRGE